MTAGLRERKKQQTRELISNHATRLFIAQGFESTTIAAVAEAADVAKMTVTNYFPLKEDLVFDRHEEIRALLADPVRLRAHAVSPLEAVRETYLRHLADQDPILGFVGLPFAHLVASSPALQSRERQIMAAQEDALAAALSEEFASSEGDIRPRLAAAQLAGLVRILYFEGRRRLVAEEPADTIVTALRASARSGFAAVGPALLPPTGDRDLTLT